ncbi:hypothetical protein DSM104443_01144 [Usitatibacter rugosus]|uniref:Autochaperone domain-containing protein n=1 Tax=Usitatibacter rugosus TaxID=2732067 RepID=A0A6M4GSL6_9PROT|nr:hypothetical protein [Usitatibacter rugosus]QJR10092.1 hypothetical protein DSM104443_01144 [Usitatibacter rugosus]
MSAVRHALVFISAAAFSLAAHAQVCPTPAVLVGGTCTVPPGTTITANALNPIALNASATGVMTANGITVNLAAANTLCALAQTAATITFSGSTATTTSVGAAANGQNCMRATGLGSAINATGATINMLPTGTVANMVGVLADTQAAITLANTAVSMSGGNGASDYGLRATTLGTITFMGGSVSTNARGGFGVFADGGTISLPGGTTVTTAGAQIAASSTGSHGLNATGAASTITASAVTVNTSATLGSAAYAEAGGTVSVTGSALSTTGAGNTNFPAAGARAVSGGQLQVTGPGATINATGQFGHGVAVQDAGSAISLTDAAVTVSGNRAYGIHVLNGANLTSLRTSVLNTNGVGVVLDGAGTTATFTDSTIRAVPATGYGVKSTLGATSTFTNGTVRAEGLNAAAFFGSTSAMTVNNVTIQTTGDGNAMGVLADLGGQITVTGGSVTTTGTATDPSTSNARRPHGLAARNPGGVLNVTGTPVITQGDEGMGVVADDGGSATIANLTVTTSGTLALGLFSVVEQAGAQFLASITGNNVVVNTSGLRAYGADSEQNFLVAPSLITLTGSSITTQGERAMGLRAVSAGTVVASSTTVLTQGQNAHGKLARSNPSSVTINAGTTVLANGLNAHGSVAQDGGRVAGTGGTVTATGGAAAALYLYGEIATSIANYNGTNLTNTSGPTIGVGGAGNATLSNLIVQGSGHWLRVARIEDFPLLLLDPPLGGILDLDPEPLPPVVPVSLRLPKGAPVPKVTPGLAGITVTNSTLNGFADTLPGNVSNVSLLGNTLWNMTGNSNLTNTVNNASRIQYSVPAPAFKTLTTVTYAGAAGNIGLNTFLGTDGSPSDTLVIDAGTATGTTLLFIANTTGPGAVTNLNGILVVNAINGATTTAGAFSLGAPVTVNGFTYQLFRGSVDASAPESWFLRNVASSPACFPPPCDPGGVPRVPTLDDSRLAILALALLVLASRRLRVVVTRASRS